MLQNSCFASRMDSAPCLGSFIVSSGFVVFISSRRSSSIVTPRGICIVYVHSHSLRTKIFLPCCEKKYPLFSIDTMFSLERKLFQNPLRMVGFTEFLEYV